MDNSNSRFSLVCHHKAAACKPTFQSNSAPGADLGFKEGGAGALSDQVAGCLQPVLLGVVWGHAPPEKN